MVGVLVGAMVGSGVRVGETVAVGSGVSVGGMVVEVAVADATRIIGVTSGVELHAATRATKPNPTPNNTAFLFNL